MGGYEEHRRFSKFGQWYNGEVRLWMLVGQELPPHSQQNRSVRAEYEWQATLKAEERALVLRTIR